MNDISENELTRVRLRFIDLIKSFFDSSPDSERLSRWRGTFSALTKEKITPEIDQQIKTLNTLLTDKKLEDLIDEYYTLFIDPFSKNLLNLTASYHIDGRSHGDSLITLRQFLHDTEISLTPIVKQPEDSLVVMFDILATLIEQHEEKDTENRQKELLLSYLIPALDLISQQAEMNPAAVFYETCLSFCNAYLNLEKSLLH